MKIFWIETRSSFMLLSRENKFIRMLESPAKLCQTWIISQTILFDRVFCSMSTSCTIQSGHPAPIVRWINHQIHWIKMNLFRRSIIQISAYFQFSMCCWTQTIWCYWQWKSLCAHILNLTQLLPTKIFTDFVVNAVILNDVSFSNMKLCLNQIDFFARVEMKCFIFLKTYAQSVIRRLYCSFILGIFLIELNQIEITTTNVNTTAHICQVRVLI